MDSIVQIIKTIILIPLGVLVATIMSLTDSPTGSSRTPMTESEKRQYEENKIDTLADCRRLSSEEFLDECYYNLATWKMDKNICEEIKEEEYLKECNDRVDEYHKNRSY